MSRLHDYLPCLKWSRGYGGETLTSDLLAAGIVTIMLIPQSLAYAMLAGLPPESCWCMNEPVSREALARVPADLQGKSCLCPHCAKPRLATDDERRWLGQGAAGEML